MIVWRVVGPRPPYGLFAEPEELGRISPSNNGDSGAMAVAPILVRVTRKKYKCTRGSDPQPSRART